MSQIQSIRIGEELDRQARRDRAYGPEPEREQGYHEETVLYQQQDDAEESYVIADHNIGDVQYWLKRFSKPLVKDAFEAAFKVLAARRAELRKELDSIYNKGGK